MIMSKKKVANKAATPAAPKKSTRKGTSSLRRGSPSASRVATADRMEPPNSGVKIRMYRQGHGDCFLLAFRQQNGDPYYMLIDCGMKKGSKLERSIKEVAEHIRDSTGGHLHLVAITHEHEDHVSGFLSEAEVFQSMTIDKLWLAWTEDPHHPLANQLRRKYKDTLLGLVSAAERQYAFAASCVRPLHRGQLPPTRLRWRSQRGRSCRSGPADRRAASTSPECGTCGSSPACPLPAFVHRGHRAAK